MNWKNTDKGLRTTLEFGSFAKAIDFLQTIVADCDSMNHHPDITLKNYNQVEFSLITHDEGKVTDKDYTLASKIAGHYQAYDK